MRAWSSFVALAVLAFAVLPAHADELTLTLDSYLGYGAPTSLNPDPNTCLPPNCVLFTGTLTDNDVDPQPDTNPSFLSIGIPYTNALDGIDFAGVLSLDNIAPTTALLSGDTNYVADLLPPNTYYGPIFGIDIPAGTPAGVYVDAVNLDIYPSNGNNPFTVSAAVTVVVTPEPAAAGLLLTGLVALAAWCGVKRKWRSSESSR